MKEKFQDLILKIEQGAISNITPILGLLIILLIVLKIFCVIDMKLLITAIGAILVFWYGYKKYERDKELEIIEKYGNKYDAIKINLIKNIEEIKKTGIMNNPYSEIINLFYIEYFFYKQGYIGEKLWNEWSYWIKEDIKKIVTFEIELIERLNGYKGYEFTKEIAIFITKKSINKEDYFSLFILRNLKDIKEDIEKNSLNLELDEDNKKFNKIRISIIEQFIEALE